MSESTSRQAALKDQFVKARGYWSPVWDDVLALDADFFEAYMQLSSVPWRTGPLPPKVKELIYVAIDASTTHHAAGVRNNIFAAVRSGLQPDARTQRQVTRIGGDNSLRDHLSTRGSPTQTIRGRHVSRRRHDVSFLSRDPFAKVAFGRKVDVNRRSRFGCWFGSLLKLRLKCLC